MRVLNRKLVRELGQMKGQILAISLVIGAGVALFVTMRSAFDSLQLTQHTYYARYRFAEVFASLERAPSYLEDEIRTIPGVERVTTRVVAAANLDVPGLPEPASGRLVSIPERRRPALNDVFLAAGREPAAGRDDEILLAENFAAAHDLAPGDRLSAVINGRRRRLEIVGLALSPEYVYTIKPGEVFPDDRRFGIAWMRREVLAAAFDMEGAFNDVALTVSEGVELEAVIDRLDGLLERYGGLGAIPRERQISHWYLESELKSLRGMGAIVPVIFLGVAAFLLNVVLSRLIALEREQIASLKALGYDNRPIALHYVKWGWITGGGGSLLGIAAGTWLGAGMTELYTDFFQFPILAYRLLPSTVVTAVAVSLAAGTLGGLGAVSRVVRLAPAEAMRPEPPERYRKGWLENPALSRILSQPARMILRHLRRRPGRVAASILAVAFGGAVVIVGNFSFDSIERIVDLQFGLAQRYDAQVTFFEPLSGRAVYELERQPGVLAVEPFRSVPARLVNGHRSHQTSILGLPQTTRLNRVIDASGRVVILPPEGLVLSDKLARMLEVEVGEEVRIEVLEGRRPVTSVPVIERVDDSIGTNAWMAEAALHRMMREDRSLSGAFLLLDEAASETLFAELKATPSVAGVTREQAAFESFQDTVGENFRIVRRLTVIFAIIIAFGVIYNNARISLSERSRELATLRVMGFTRGEIAYILLGELAIVSLAAAGLGLLVGYGLAGLAAQAFDTEVYRIPLVVAPATFALSAVIVLVASVLSALAVRRRLDRLDLIAVLKTRE